MDADPLSVGSQVRRRATGEVGVVVGAYGEYRDVMFAASGRATLHVRDLEPATTDPLADLKGGRLASHEEFTLRLEALYLKHAYKYDKLSGLSNARIEPKLHQVFVAHRVAKKLHPRMILADEVGLGKTIEAGLIIKEQIARGLADRILVICPASLQYQWQYEMQGKFNEEFVIIDSPTLKLFERDGSNPWTKVDKAITSLQLVRRRERAEQVVEAPWDMVVFDEAHHVRRRYEGPNRFSRTLAYELAEELKELVDGLLMLTATPMQLHPFELYSLIDLVEPGLYPSYEAYDLRRREMPRLNALMRDLQGWNTLDPAEKAASFNQHADVLTEFGVDDFSKLDDHLLREDLMDELTVKHPLTLTMVRNRKSVVGGFTKRDPSRIPVSLKPEEEDVYEAVTRYIHEGYNRARLEQNNAVGFLMVLYQKLLSSSSHALRSSFKKRAARLRELVERAVALETGELTREDLEDLYAAEELDDAVEALEEVAMNIDEALWEIDVLEGLIDRLGRIKDSKAEVLIYDLIRPLLRDHPEEKVLIFTGFIKTQEFLAHALESAGYSVVTFNGKMDLVEKERAVRDFRTKSQIMITTEAGGEGRNFQFAHIMVNYDLPWNPMKVEQRIGRLDRIGQKKPVLIYNLACEGTVEDHVLNVLEHRIGLFEESVGSLDPILGDVERDLERLIMEHVSDLDRELERYAVQLEKRVREAKEKERLLADFIMDRASFRRDEAAELLDEDPLATWRDLKEFTERALNYYGGRLSSHTEGGYSLSFSPNLSHMLGIKSSVIRGEFDPQKALEAEDLPFFAFGNDVVDSVVSLAANNNAAVGARRLEDAPPGWSVEIIYALEAEGVRPSGRLIRHLVGSDLVVHETPLASMPDPGEPVQPPEPFELRWVADAIEASRHHVQRALAEDRERAEAEHEENRTLELERLERVFEHRRQRLEDLVNEAEAWIAEKEQWGSEDDRRILPARKGKLKRDRERLANLKHEYEARVAALEARRADVRSQVVAAAIVRGE